MKRLLMLAVVCLTVLSVAAAAQEKTETPEEITITDAQKLYTLSLLWSEAKYNFVYFDQVPDLDWDAAYQEYIPKVLATKDALEFYRALTRFMVLLHDGHTGVWMPQSLWKGRFDQPPMFATEMEGKPVIFGVAKQLAEQIPVGSEILAVDGVPVFEYLEKEIYPYISASTSLTRLNFATFQNIGGIGMLIRPKGSEITLGYRTPSGEERDGTFACDLSDYDKVDWEIISVSPRFRELMHWRWLEDGIAYVALNRFSDKKIIEEFEAILPELYKAKGIILDIRLNGGGSTNIGIAILDHFSDQVLPGPMQKSREHRSAFYAWGRNPNSEYHDTYGTLNAWYEIDSTGYDSKPVPGRKIKVPVVVLTDYSTGSAAEDFLLYADPLEQFTYVGRPSNGSTGQPINYELPGGGGARICAKRDSFSDGREFVGYGIQPDVFCERTIKSFLEKRDKILEKGVEVFKEKMTAESGK